MLRRPVFVHRHDDFARACENCEKIEAPGKKAKRATPVHKIVCLRIHRHQKWLRFSSFESEK